MNKELSQNSLKKCYIPIIFICKCFVSTVMQDLLLWYGLMLVLIGTQFYLPDNFHPLVLDLQEIW